MPDFEKRICIHGHFYQPPRESPWLDVIEVQDSAAPFHDWNERVNAECYAANAEARLLDAQGKIRRLLNNYAHISFDFGPTLLSWLERCAPAVYEKVLEGDRLSRRARSGHGNAIAQAYNHVIMPLASERDRHTQLVWGMEDFRQRFGRDPEGMWLPEAAADNATLALMAELGLRFTILSPRQAARYREPGGEWKACPNGSIDPSRPYNVELPGGRSLALFFYDGPISQAVAFEQLLGNGEFFAGRLRAAFDARRPWAQLVHIATDGESYGHHHRFGEMALAYAIERIEERGDGGPAASSAGAGPAAAPIMLTNYGEFLARHPAEVEVEIVENSSWSCAHGVERWRADCGCSSGAHPDWRQKWRAPLRAAFDGLKQRVDELYETQAGECFADPWATRDRYIGVILARDPQRAAEFARREAGNPGLGEEQVTRCLTLLEMARHAQLMFTSCGWFFDDVSGLEPAQNMRYAARALQLAARLGGDWESEFLDRLALAPSNDPRLGNGRAVFERLARPSIVDGRRVVAHYAIMRALDADVGTPALFAYEAEELEFERHTDGANTLALGRARIVSRTTLSRITASFAALHVGGRDVQCGVIESQSPQAYAEMRKHLRESFLGGSLARVVRGIDRYFPHCEYGFRDLFLDARRRALEGLSRDAIDELTQSLSALYERDRPLIALLRQSDIPLPGALRVLASLMNQRAIEAAAQAFIEKGESGPLLDALEDSRRLGVQPDLAPATGAIGRHLLDELASLGDEAAAPAIRAFADKVREAQSMGLALPLWELQNRFFARYSAARAAPAPGARQRQEAWRQLAGLLGFAAGVFDNSAR